MSTFATDKYGVPIFAACYSDQEWQNLKDTYQVGDLLMPCCSSPAIPKTSPNFLNFFSHYSDECATSPESIWHLNAKENIVRELGVQGINAFLEYSGGSDGGNWKADVYFENSDRKIAIEIQKSYQHLREYFKRQKRYALSGVEAYWLLYQPRYITLIKSLGKYKLKNEYGGKFPPEGYIAPCVPELPLAFYQISDEVTSVKGARFNCSLKEWLEGILTSNFIYERGFWKLGERA